MALQYFKNIKSTFVLFSEFQNLNQVIQIIPVPIIRRNLFDEAHHVKSVCCRTIYVSTKYKVVRRIQWQQYSLLQPFTRWKNTLTKNVAIHLQVSDVLWCMRAGTAVALKMPQSQEIDPFSVGLCVTLWGELKGRKHIKLRC